MSRAWQRSATAEPGQDTRTAPAAPPHRAASQPWPGGASGFLVLQRSAGNAAVAGLAGETKGQATVAAGAPVLTPTQVAHAISATFGFRYDLQVVHQVRTALGLPARGTVDEQFVQAVAQWQAARTRYPPLDVDGIVGPNELPLLLPFGLVTPGAVGQFAAGVRGLDQTWAGETPEQRLADLMRLANERLAARQVPPLEAAVADHLGTVNGRFNHQAWQIEVARRYLLGTAADAATLIYHEVRHAEEAFTIAQTVAVDTGGSVSERVAAVVEAVPGLNENVARIAALTGPPSRAERAIARGWLHNRFANPNQARIDRLTAAADALEPARDVARAERDRARAAGHPDPAKELAYQKAQAPIDRLRAEYHKLAATEHDASVAEYLVGDALGVEIEQ
jgi:hypothetical protein